MKYFKIFITTAMVIYSGFCCSQNLKWASDFGSFENNNTSALITKKASNGDYIVTGVLQGTIDFDLSSLSYPLTASYRDLFIARYSSTGSFIWAKLLKGKGWSGTENGDFNIDKDGNIILCLTSDDNIDFNPSPTNTFYLSSKYNDTDAAFLAKYDENGNFLWANKFDTDKGLSPCFIETDLDGNIFLSGSYLYSQDFDFTSAQSILQGNSQTGNVFLAKYNPSGGLLFAKIAVQSSDGVGILKMKLINNNELVFIGSFISGRFNTDENSTFFASSTNGGYIAKYKTDGTFVCVNIINLSSYIGSVADVTIDKDNNMYVAGYFRSSVDFNGTANPGQSIASKTEYTSDGFVVKYNSQAEVVWYFSIGGTEYSTSCNGISIDSKNNLLVTGIFTREVDFDPSLSGYQTLTNTGGDAIFAASYTLDKQYISVKQLTTPGNMHLQNMQMQTYSGEFALSGLAYNKSDVDPSENTAIMNEPNSSWLVYYISVYNMDDAEIPTSLLTSKSSSSLMAYPNPAVDNTVYIKDVTNTILNATPIITTSEGTIVPFTYTQDQEKITLNLSGLRKGVYFITIGENTVKIIL